MMSGSFEMPPNTTLVSAVYLIRTSAQLMGSLTVEIEHSVSVKSKDDIEALNFVYSSDPMFVFHPLAGGRFQIGSRWGIIELSSFSAFGVTANSTISKTQGSYKAQINSNKKDTLYDVVLLAGRNLNVFEMVSILPLYVVQLLITVHALDGFFVFEMNILYYFLQAIKRDYGRWERLSAFDFVFTNGSSTLSLLIDSNGVQNPDWSIWPKATPPQVVYINFVHTCVIIINLFTISDPGDSTS